jgi:phage baseplate assembly protein W
MPQTVTSLRSTNWQISTAGFGVVAEGLEDVRQCLDIILRTTKGTDSFRPEFGSDIYQYIDYPVNVAVANIKRSILEAVEIWEKRVKVVSISHSIVESRLFFKVTYQLVDQDILDSLLISGGGGDIAVAPVGSLILQAFYPANPNGRAYTLNLVLDGQSVKPSPPAEGFITINGLYAWAQQNLGYLGRWQQLVDRIVLYLNPGFATTGSIGIELLTSQYRYQALLPFLVGAEYYSVTLKHMMDGVLVTETIDVGTSDNKSDLLSALNAAYSAYGKWSIVPGSVDILGDFNNLEFSNDFLIGGSVGYYLVLTTSTISTAVLNVTANG